MIIVLAQSLLSCYCNRVNSYFIFLESHASEMHNHQATSLLVVTVNFFSEREVYVSTHMKPRGVFRFDKNHINPFGLRLY